MKEITTTIEKQIPDELLNYKEAAVMLNMTQRALASLVKEGSVPIVQFSKNRVRFDKNDLLKFIEDCKINV